MKNMAVVFDTNVYRDIAAHGPEITDVVNAERLNGIVSYANPYVIMELASHLAEVDQGSFAECRRGLTDLYNHCLDPESLMLRIVADSESLVCYSLFQVVPNELEVTTQALSRFAKEVAECGHGDIPPTLRRKAAIIKKQVMARESNFIIDMRDVAQTLNPNHIGWNPFKNDPEARDSVLKFIRKDEFILYASKIYVIKAHKMSNRSSNSEVINDMAEHLKDHIRPSLELYREILIRLVSTGVNIERRSRCNWLWDMQIAFGIGETFNEPPHILHLITSDDDIIQAARAAKCDDYVFTITAYLDKLGLA